MGEIVFFMCKKESYKENYIKIRSQENHLATDYSVSRLIVVLSTKCSLKCRDCNNLIPLFNSKSDLNTDKIISSLQSILNVVDCINRVELIGGEPFLASNLEEVLKFVLGQEKIVTIEMTTNGTVIPKESLIPLLQDSKVKICISDYNEIVDCKKIIDFCQKYALKYHVLTIKHWINSGGIVKRFRSFDQLTHQYLSCQSSYLCKTLFEDKLFQCARASSLYALNICDDVNGYLKVDSSISKERLFDFIFGDNNPACDYCNTATSDGLQVAPAIQEGGGKDESKRDTQI